jgi:hypothetical protein
MAGVGSGTEASATAKGNGRGEQLLRRMLRAREAVVWLGMVWLLYGMVVLAVVLLAGPESTSKVVVEGAPTDLAVVEGQRSLAERLNPDQWMGGHSWGARLLAQSANLLVLVTVALLVWLALAVLSCASHFAGPSYAAGHALLVVLGAPVLLLGPIWVPLLVADDVRRGHTARVRRLPNPTGMDVFAAGLLAGLAAAAYLVS